MDPGHTVCIHTEEMSYSQLSVISHCGEHGGKK